MQVTREKNHLSCLFLSGKLKSEEHWVITAWQSVRSITEVLYSIDFPPTTEICAKMSSCVHDEHVAQVPDLLYGLTQTHKQHTLGQRQTSVEASE